MGLTFHLQKTVPSLISKNIEKCLEEAFKPLGISDWNSLFWIAHPGGPTILDHIEIKLGLKAEKMKATRHVLSEYGNMSNACVFFILDTAFLSCLPLMCALPPLLPLAANVICSLILR